MGESARLTQIMSDPLRYIHPGRLRLPGALDTLRQRAVVNHMLLTSYALPLQPPVLAGAVHQLLQNWLLLPYICTLLGALLLKPALAWGGKLLRLSAPVRFFMLLPLPPAIAPVGGNDAVLAALPGDTLEDKVQAAGLQQVLRWQGQAPQVLTARMRLMFAPELDCCFERAGLPLQAADLFLISQAIQYAKNHPDHV